MPLTMTPDRFEEIRRRVHERRLATDAAEVVTDTDWTKQPAFTSVDELLNHLDRQAAPQDRPPGSRCRKKC